MAEPRSLTFDEFSRLLRKQFELLRLVDHYEGDKKVELLSELAQVESQLYSYRDRKDFLERFVAENPTLG